MTKVSELRSQSKDELGEALVKLKKEQFNLRFQKATGQLESTSRVRQVRRDIARILTVLGQEVRGEKATTAVASKPKARAAKATAEKKPAKRAAKKK